MSAIGTDLLWLRFYLFAAYVFLFAAALTNFPPWGTWDRVSPDLWLLGAILWPFFVGKEAQAFPKGYGYCEHHLLVIHHGKQQVTMSAG